MSFDLVGFEGDIEGNVVTITVTDQHPLIRLGKALDWEAFLIKVLPDLKRTEKSKWWLGRALRIRIHLGIYLLQQMFNLTDRQAEYFLKDNAAFRLFCGYGLVKKWHAPDHTKIEEFRSRLLPETQRCLANLISVHAVKLGYANPKHLDIDSTVQQANIAYPTYVNLLTNVALLARRLVKPLNQRIQNTINKTPYYVDLRDIKARALHYFCLKRKDKELCQGVLKSLWQAVFKEVLPILKDSHQLIKVAALPGHWALRRNLELLQWRGYKYLEDIYEYLFEGKSRKSQKRVYALHLEDIMAFNKKKLSKKVEYGRAYQLGRIEGNFMFVQACTSLNMPDAQPLPQVVEEHKLLYEEDLYSVSVDRGYYSLSNRQFLEQKQVKEIGLPRPGRTLNAARDPTSLEIQKKLHCRRAGIEPLIGHIKHGGQMGRGRMKKDSTTLSSGYAAVLAFNLRQLKNAILGKNSFKNRQNEVSVLGIPELIPQPG